MGAAAAPAGFDSLALRNGLSSDGWAAYLVQEARMVQVAEPVYPADSPGRSSWSAGGGARSAQSASKLGRTSRSSPLGAARLLAWSSPCLCAAKGTAGCTCCT